MGRPRKVTDTQIFEAAYRATARLAPGDLTLAAIAEEAGVTAGALVQRFGSKRALLLQLAEGAAAGSGAFLASVRARHRSPLAALRDYAECIAHLAPSADVVARNLAYLQIDVADPDFRRHLESQYRQTREWLEVLIRDAVRAGELAAGTNPARVARAVEAALSGALLTWAVYQDGPAASWLRETVDAVVAPYRRTERGVRRRGMGRRRD